MATEQLLHQQIGLDFDRKASKFTVTIGGEVLRQNVCEFLLTSSFLLGQDVERFLLDTDSCYDQIKIPMTSTGRSVTLDLASFVRLRDVYGRQLYLLKLEDMLLHRGIVIS